MIVLGNPVQFKNYGKGYPSGKWYVATREDIDGKYLYLRKDGTVIANACSYDENYNIIPESSGYFDTEEEALEAIKGFNEKQELLNELSDSN